jgi:hypothetical protein
MTNIPRLPIKDKLQIKRISVPFARSTCWAWDRRAPFRRSARLRPGEIRRHFFRGRPEAGAPTSQAHVRGSPSLSQIQVGMELSWGHVYSFDSAEKSLRLPSAIFSV